ncbi:unnamed protein product [Cuscuta epithymum]|uniref:FBD domain-containing protein n=1 Tax=Cuscuta epithymum TaxID=186058 RepID=A0AAV0EJ08_9ASTE|nr:unnamed protein product [Cuscuta epithymum]
MSGILMDGWCLIPASTDPRLDFVNMITNILLLRSGPVKIFKLVISSSYLNLRLQQQDIDRWCLFLTRNGIEQLHLSVYYSGDIFKVPVSIISCPTIKKLNLAGFAFNCPVTAGPSSPFSGVTTLIFNRVWFSRNKHSPVIPFSIPKLEVLVLCGCVEMDKFSFSAPKLKTFRVTRSKFATEWKWFELHLKVIKTLHLSNEFIMLDAHRPSFPTALNLEVIKLFHFIYVDKKPFALLLQLLKKCPKLSELEILMHDKFHEMHGDASSTSADPGSWLNGEDINMLKKVKVEQFRGLRYEVLFIKTILSKSPMLEEVVILESPEIDAQTAFRMPREMIKFPRASPKAQIIFLKTQTPIYNLVGPIPNFW